MTKYPDKKTTRSFPNELFMLTLLKLNQKITYTDNQDRYPNHKHHPAKFLEDRGTVKILDGAICDLGDKTRSIEPDRISAFTVFFKNPQPQEK